MSAPESFDPVRHAPADDGVAAFTRWPGLLVLSLGVLLGPTVALTNQELIYAVGMWACAHGRWVTHIVPALCLIVTAGTTASAVRSWRAVGRGAEDEEATIATRTRFLAITGIGVSAFSCLVIIVQWVAVFVFDPCQGI